MLAALAFVLSMAVAPVMMPDTAPPAQQEAKLRVTVDPAAGGRATVHVGAVLRDSELEKAALSGLPIRVRIHVELWKDRVFDALVDSSGKSFILVYEPISQQFIVRTDPGSAGGSAGRFNGYEAARATIETQFTPRIQPRGSGRFYYTVSLQIETLSVSDLEELERWLQGELQPAVSGQRSVPGAIGQGAKRLMLRLLDLPAARYDARTQRFRITT
jgi:hypothetical protein